MLHCHELEHEDNGMMASEYVFGSGNTCTCGDDLTDQVQHLIRESNIELGYDFKLIQTISA